MIVAQDKPQVDMLVRNAEGSWELQQFNSLEDELFLPCLDMGLTMRDVYSRVEFELQVDH